MKHFQNNLMVIEMKEARVKMAKLLHLGISILDISKILMYEFWYGYIRPKYGDKTKLCYTDFFEDISNDVERWFDAKIKI